VSAPITPRVRKPSPYRRPPYGMAVIGVGLILLGITSAWLLLGIGNTPPTRIGHASGDFTLTSLAGNAVHLSDFKGQVVMLNGWGTWCPPCRAEMPTLNAFYRLHQAQGFQLLAINAGEDRAAVASFIAQTGFTFPVLLDPGELVLSSLGTRGLPTTYIIGRDGVLKSIHVGEFAAQDLATEVAPLLN
jgi:cytochrome c biogenesis protein CcmG, thiol:disulfide interchange protein DsbE